MCNINYQRIHNIIVSKLTIHKIHQYFTQLDFGIRLVGGSKKKKQVYTSEVPVDQHLSQYCNHLIHLSCFSIMW